MQLNLGLMYHGGQGVPQDSQEAAKWFHKAAEQGAAKAQFSLGVVCQWAGCLAGLPGGAEMVSQGGGAGTCTGAGQSGCVV